MKNKKLFLFSSLLIFLLIVFFVISIIAGSENIFLMEKNSARFILLNLRLPRSILVLLSGSLLAASGALFQGFFRNSLADSGIIGVSSAATLGAVIAEFLPLFLKNFIGKIVTPSVIGAFVFSLFCALIISSFSRLNRGDKTVSILLGGTALGAFFSALTSIIILMHDREMHKIYIWNLGSFSGKGWSELYFILLPSLVSFILLSFCSRRLDLISAGELSAQAMGLNVKSFQNLVLASGCLCASCAVCSGGTISFIGLISPHIIRKCTGPQSKTLFPLSCLSGSILLLLSDLICRTAARPAEIPIGIITALIGSPFFLWILFSNRGSD